MGARHSIYVGPYVILELKPVNFRRQINSCPNTACTAYGSDTTNQFCPHCGSKIEAISIPATGVRGWLSFLEDHDYKYEDHLWMPEFAGVNGSELLLSNYSGDYDFDRESSAVSVSQIARQIDPSMDRFYEEHAELIEKMKQYFDTNMTIDYGVVSYWS